MALASDPNLALVLALTLALALALAPTLTSDPTRSQPSMALR